MLQFAQKIAEPFDVKVKLGDFDFVQPPVSKLSIDPGETAFNAIEQACRAAGLLVTTDGEGALLLTQPSEARAHSSLVEGKNVLSASISFDHTARHHRYIVLSQTQGTDENHGKAASTRGEAVDAEVTRTERVLLLRPEASLTRGQAKARAEWEATVRAARAATASVTVQGFKMGNGELWPLNRLVSVCVPSIELGEQEPAGPSASKAVVSSVAMLITGVAFSFSRESGSTTTLTLRRPDAFTPEPVITSKGDGYRWHELDRLR